MAAEARKSPQTQETLAPPVLTLLLSLKAELLRLHFLPLKQKYDDSLRNIPRTEPNPAAYIGRQADLYNNSRNACKERIARQLHEQIDNVLLQATTELDSWLTEVKTPAKADGPRDIRDAPGQGAAVPTPKKGVETRDGTQANTIKDLPRARYQATIEDVPDAGDEEDSLFVPQSPSPGSSGLSSMSGFTDNLIAEDLKPAKPAVGGDPKGKAPEQKLRQPEASHQPQARGPDTQSPADPKPKPPRQQDRVSVSAKYRDGKITFTPANPSAGAKRPSASVTDYFTPTKQPAAKKAKHASDAAAPKLPPMVPKPYLTTKNTISITEVNEDECVHHFGQHKGLYVLRCNKLACKNRVREQEGAARKVSSPRNLARMTVYFSANPLDSDRALDHFKGRGHGLRQMKDIYEKYAVRVTDAIEDRNLGNPADKTSCVRLGPVHGTNPAVEASILNRCSSPELGSVGAGTSSRTADVSPLSGKGGNWKGASTAAKLHTAQPIPEPASASDGTIQEEQEPRRKPPMRAAASAVTSYGPFPISDDETEKPSRKKVVRLETHVNGVNTSPIKSAVSASTAKTKEHERTTPTRAASAGVSAGQSRADDGGLSSDSDDSDSSIPPVHKIAKRSPTSTSRVVYV